MCMRIFRYHKKLSKKEKEKKNSRSQQQSKQKQKTKLNSKLLQLIMDFLSKLTFQQTKNLSLFEKNKLILMNLFLFK